MVNEMNAKAIKIIIIFLMACAYVVGVAYAEIMFLQIVSKMFPTGAAGGFAMVGAVVAGITALCMPVALHWWFAPGLQFAVGVIFYLLDLAMLAANAMLSYQMAAGGPIDPLFVKWREFCPATPIFCVAGLALVFAFDVSHKLRHAQIAIRTVQIERIARGMEQGLNSKEAQDYLAQIGIQATWFTAEQLHGHTVPHALPPGTIVEADASARPRVSYTPAPRPRRTGGLLRKLADAVLGTPTPETSVPTNASAPEAQQSDPLAETVAMTQDGALPTQNGK